MDIAHVSTLESGNCWPKDFSWDVIDVIVILGQSDEIRYILVKVRNFILKLKPENQFYFWCLVRGPPFLISQLVAMSLSIKFIIESTIAKSTIPHAH